MPTKYYLMCFNSTQRHFLAETRMSLLSDRSVLSRSLPTSLKRQKKGIDGVGHSGSWRRSAQLPCFQWYQWVTGRARTGSKTKIPQLVTAHLVYFWVTSSPSQQCHVSQPLTRAANQNLACSDASCKGIQKQRAIFLPLKRICCSNYKFNIFVLTPSQHTSLISLLCSSQEGHELNEA